MSLAIDTLRHDHDAILMALTILDRIADEAVRGKTTSADVAGFIGFLQEFADKCHHGKEEGLLFPAMIEAGMAESGGPISVMLAEHEQGRVLVAKMARAAGPDLEAKSFAEAATAYSALLRAHIDKENNVLFPLAEGLIDPVVLVSLNEAFAAHEERVIGHGRHEQLHDMLKVLKAKYLRGDAAETRSTPPPMEPVSAQR